MMISFLHASQIFDSHKNSLGDTYLKRERERPKLLLFAACGGEGEAPGRRRPTVLRCKISPVPGLTSIFQGLA
ncbi:hypothetical protein MRB53_019347 [Persea americana]|uniref:Uncharacterized protein n=1 Tax=Persea americana TaxID=3435 RepID=A0ACC2KXZ1_PERAE|nr:hypothetical protein MRB53_019347 [Persea americana]